ncbi:hypothetical protein WICPIJ_002014 [Wickerhamomyces pijperi]|uniref:CAP-Gly domain-containing protein n=1 Tax=Wickerhamomyces pijperi TaxID=599730 RepID=A0A9P8TQ85_WICPI|nr:hypothetical protein WICPIJ_002014 [Wickerhamomyces pijperi]
MSSNQTNHRHSHIPSTPTPHSKPTIISTAPAPPTNVVPGVVLILRNIGRAKVQYIGPVDGKPGQFVGLELQGDSLKYGKNNGQVNGKSYFTLENGVENSGLFMPLDKLLGVIKSTESPQLQKIQTSFPSVSSTPYHSNTSQVTSRSISPFGIPKTAVTHSMTPKLDTLNEKTSNKTSMTSYPVRSSSSSVRRVSNGSLPPSSPRLASSSSTLEKELKKIVSSKAIIESERDTLAKQTEDLKLEIRNLTERLHSNEAMILELQAQTEESLNLLQKADERVFTTDERLAMQKKLFEQQRTQLFEVIDQVEKQVHENEGLYLGELNKLKEELTQRTEILESLEAEKQELEEQLTLAKRSTTPAPGDGQHSVSDEGQIQGLKKTISTQTKGIMELSKDIKEKNETISRLSKESLELKQEYLNERQILVKENTEIKEQLADRDSKLADLESEMLALTARLDSMGKNDSKSDVMESTGLAEAEKVKYTTEIEQLMSKIKALEVDTPAADDGNSDDYSQLLKANDKIQELEYKLESKEKIISDLKQDLTNRGEGGDSEDTSDLVDSLRVEISKHEQDLSALKSELTSAVEEKGQLQTQLDMTLKKLEDLDLSLKEKQTWIDENKAKISQSDSLIVEVEDLQTKLKAKDEELSKISSELNSLKISATDSIKLETLQKSYEDLTNVNKELEIKLEGYDDILVKVAEFEAQAKQLDQYIAKLDSLKEEKDSLLKKLEVLESVSGNNEDIDAKLREMKVEYQQMLDEKEAELKGLTAKNDQLQAQLHELETTSNKNIDNQQIDAQLQEMKLHNQELDHLLEEMTIELDLLKEEASQKDTDIETTAQLKTTNDNLQKQIAELNLQLQQLKSQHQQELTSLEEEFTGEVNTLQEKLAIAVLTEPSSTSTTPLSDINIDSFKTYTPNKGTDKSPSSSKPSDSSISHHNTNTNRFSSVSTNRFSTASSISLRPPVISQVVDGELQVYVPPKLDLNSDAKNERRLWCGLCERDGHDSIDCPFEIDVDVF